MKSHLLASVFRSSTACWKRRVVVVVLEILIDDLTGDELDQSGETIRFSLDGNDCEIDLSAGNVFGTSGRHA